MSSRTAPPAHSGQWRRAYLGIAGLFCVAPAAGLLVGYLALPNHISSHCEGTVFGCMVTPKDGIMLLAMYVYPLAVVAGLLIMGAVATVRAWRHRSWGRRGATCKLSHAFTLGVAPPASTAKRGNCLGTVGTPDASWGRVTH